MATDTDLALRVRSALAEYLKRDVTTFKPGDALRNDLDLDSLTTIELLYRIEEEFDGEVADTDLPGLVPVAPRPPTSSAERPKPESASRRWSAPPADRGA